MEELKNNKLVWLALGMAALLFVSFIGSAILEKAADKAIERRLQKQFSPSFYGPGLDPDKLSPKAVVKTAQKQGEPVQATIRFDDKDEIRFTPEWREGWEAERLNQ